MKRKAIWWRSVKRGAEIAPLKLVKKKECLVPTCWGWLFIVFAAFTIGAGYMRYIHSFLSLSRPVPAQILAVEEWLPPRALESAASEFEHHGYSLLVVLGDEKRWVVPILEKAGVDKTQIVTIPLERVRKDRTFASAVALGNWLLSSGMSGKPVNIFTLGVHARRSWVLFRKALGSGSAVGIISCENPYYDPGRWWRSSEGFKAVLDETLAYLYTELFFLPARGPEMI